MFFFKFLFVFLLFYLFQWFHFPHFSGFGLFCSFRFVVSCLSTCPPDRATTAYLKLLSVTMTCPDILFTLNFTVSVWKFHTLHSCLQYFYSIKDISVGGICMCNGHADACVQRPGESQFRCSCKHKTCGVKCEECCPGFVQKEWKPATAESSNECERKSNLIMDI